MAAVARTRVALRRRPAAWLAAAVVLLPLLALGYGALAGASSRATVRIAVLAWAPASALPAHVTPQVLDSYAADLRSQPVAEAARLQLTPPTDGPADLAKAAVALRRRVTVGTNPAASELVLTARDRSGSAAAGAANAYASSLLTLRRIRAGSDARLALAAATRRLDALAPGASARGAILAGLSQTIAPLVDRDQIQVVRPAADSSRPLLIAVVASVLCLVGLAAALVLGGVWRPRAARAA